MEYENIEINSERWLNLANLLNEEWRDIRRIWRFIPSK